MITRQQFVRDLGYAEKDVELYQALMFQPRAVLAIVAAGASSGQAWVFLALGVTLWWSALVPALNPFDVIYNTAVARRVAIARLGASPAPRRFSMGVGGLVSLSTAATMASGLTTAATALQALFTAALVGVVLGRLCGPAKVYGRFGSARHAAHDVRSRPART